MTAEGCRRRRERLWAKLDPPLDTDYVLLSDPIRFPAYLLVRKDDHAKLLHENRAPKSTLRAHADG